MSKFIKIIIDKHKNELRNIEYVPQAIALYERFSRYLHDDYFIGKKSSTDAVIELIERTSPYFWAIIHKKSKKLAGFVFLDNWVGAKGEFHSAEVTTCFDPKFWGNYTKFCAKKFIKYCFKTYRFEKLKACIFPENFKVKMLLKRSGFHKEAILKAETLKNGSLQDIEIFAVHKSGKEITK